MNKKSNKKTGNKELFRLAFPVVVAICLLSSLVFAVSTPSGISGTVFDLDGITEVPQGTLFSINDT